MTACLRSAIFLLVLTGLPVAGCTPPGETVCIRVGDTRVDTDAFRTRLERLAEESMIDSRELLDKVKPMLVATMVEGLLIGEYARDNHITVTDEEVAIAMKGYTQGMQAGDLDRILAEEYRHAEDIETFIRTRRTAEKAVDRAVRSRIAILPAEIRQHYDGHHNDYQRPTSVELYHVFMQERLKAKEALVLLRSGVPLGHVVQRYSISEDMHENGFMGVFVKGELPVEVEEVVFSIPEQRYSGIIETSRGFHIFYVEKRIAAGLAPLEEVQDSIHDELYQQRFEKAYRTWMEALRQEYRPEVNWNEINSASIL